MCARSVWHTLKHLCHNQTHFLIEKLPSEEFGQTARLISPVQGAVR